MSAESTESASRPLGFRREFPLVWKRIPDKGLFFGLLAGWLLLFHLLGNSTLGYVETPSFFGWLHWTYENSADDQHGWFMPLVVLGLMWWKRRELLAVPTRNWWPALVLVCLGLIVHVLGYLIQQTRLSVVGFFVGLYGLMGLVWGPRLLAASFFPYFLFAFCLPLGGSTGLKLTFPLRLLATKITAGLTDVVLGIDVIQNGTRIFDPMGSYQYEVAAACSGIRSLTAILALSLIYAFVMFRKQWKRLVLVAAAFPLAIAANVFRLTSIIVAAEMFGQAAGNRVHESSWMSLMPYVPALAGLLLLGRWLREDQPAARSSFPAPQGLPKEQKV